MTIFLSWQIFKVKEVKEAGIWLLSSTEKQQI
jgi:hypothetical protein